MAASMRIGAVNYLNSKPLVCGLQRLRRMPGLRMTCPADWPIRWPPGGLDVALVPVVEFFRTPGQRIVSDACVACQGPVLSVKLHFRVPPKDVRRVALDEGSRTSAALTQDSAGRNVRRAPGVGAAADRLRAGNDRCRRRPADRRPSDCGLRPRASAGIADSTSANSGRNPQSAIDRGFVEEWDLGERWCSWTGLPFVFAMWVARADVDVDEVAAALPRPREIGEWSNSTKSPSAKRRRWGFPTELAKSYFRDNLHFTLGRQERDGLRRFYELCVAHNLRPAGLERELKDFDFEHVCRK